MFYILYKKINREDIMFRKIAHFIEQNKLDRNKNYTAKELSEQGFMVAAITSQDVPDKEVAETKLSVDAEEVAVLPEVESTVSVETVDTVIEQQQEIVVSEQVVATKKKGGRPKKTD